MNFKPLNLVLPDYNGAAIMCITFIIGAFIVFLLTIFFLHTGLSIKKKIIVSAISVAVIFGFALTATNTMNNFNQSVHEYNENNKNTATENLMKKYNLQEVKWSSSDTSVSPTTSSGDGDLLVKTSKGENYIFKYHVDEKNSEPFLEDMPIRGGAAPTQAVTAKSLLK